MAIGYACKTIGVIDTTMRSCLLKDATKDKLMEIIEQNIAALNRIIDYNIENNIRLFRISSDLIPFGSSSINSIKWWEHFREALKNIGQKIKDSNMRVSLHPGQYTVLNSVKRDVVARAFADLSYHTKILDSLGLDSTHKIVLHIGGAYKDKKVSAKRFLENYRLLDERIRRRLVIENDDKIYNVQDVLDIGTRLKIPVIFDNLHNEINPADEEKDEFVWIDLCRNSWREQDGIQKIHYSQQSKQKQKGSHSDFISVERFMAFYKKINRNDLDIMLEVKDKNLSCIKCINCITDDSDQAILGKEWNRYKYTVLERAPSLYTEIENMFEKDDLSAVSFYKLIEGSLESPGDIGSYTNALQHVWGYFSTIVTEKEKRTFLRNLERYQKQQAGVDTVKNKLKRLAEKYKQDHLINSYYFLL
jgi:UV DNA damage endonuclease